MCKRLLIARDVITLIEGSVVPPLWLNLGFLAGIVSSLDPLCQVVLRTWWVVLLKDIFPFNWKKKCLETKVNFWVFSLNYILHAQFIETSQSENVCLTAACLCERSLSLSLTRIQWFKLVLDLSLPGIAVRTTTKQQEIPFIVCSILLLFFFSAIPVAGHKSPIMHLANPSVLDYLGPVPPSAFLSN